MVKPWAKSKNQCVGQVFTVSSIEMLERRHVTEYNLDNIFDIATILLYNKKYLVQKDYGWMLKSASAHSQKKVFGFIMANKRNMSRMASRYAIGKMSKCIRNKAMA